MLNKILSPQPWNANGYDWASLILRVSFGGLMAYNHGYSKFNDLIGGATEFPDPIGIGAYPSFIMTVFVELVCCVLLVAGLFTRFAAVALSVTLFIVAFTIHAADPLDVKEHALLFGFAGIVIFLMGAGKYSLDHVRASL